jgi:hypothetical protein
LSAVVRACTRQEVEFLLTYRQADKAGKRRLTKVLYAAEAGRLPPVEQIQAMTPMQARAFADSLPEVSP